KAGRYVRNRDALQKLFGELAERFVGRPGGYTRILKTRRRLGDNAEMAIIELLTDADASSAPRVKAAPAPVVEPVVETAAEEVVEAAAEEVVEAAQAVGAHNFIMNLPDGYDTMLEQRGGNLSLGQRQLISFARAIVADSKILVLDEATASIDSYTEMLIQQALQRLLEGRTGMVIAHRLATIRGADRIIVLQDGNIIESGSHDELIDLGGLYSRLYSMNYASFDDIPDELIQQAAQASEDSAT
ncbi:MAG: L17 family ribosomal protein, partial [Dehalococcoidia bacterium]